MNLFASYGMQYMKEYYINESLKSTQKKKKELGGGKLFYTDLFNFYPFLYTSWKYFVCHRQNPFQWFHCLLKLICWQAEKQKKYRNLHENHPPDV